jgi:hypothetical protein
VLFNRFYQPDFDIRTLKPIVQAELSTSAELLLRLRWIALLHGRIRPSLPLSGGVAVKEDGIKAILAGADAVHMKPGWIGVGLRIELRHMTRPITTSPVDAVTIEWLPLDAI